MRFIREHRLGALSSVAFLVIVAALLQGCAPADQTSSDYAAPSSSTSDGGNSGVSRFNRGDPRALAGFADIIFIGVITKKLGNQPSGAIPSTQYEAAIVESLKSGNTGLVTLSQVDTGEDGSDNATLTTGSTYLFAGRYSAQNKWYTLVSGSLGATKLDSAATDALRSRPGADSTDPPVVKRMREAIASEIPFTAAAPRPKPPANQKLGSPPPSVAPGPESPPTSAAPTS